MPIRKLIVNFTPCSHINAPKHAKVRSFVGQGLLGNLLFFHELVARITALPTTKDRGDAFEVFAEAYLATQPIVQAQS